MTERRTERWLVVTLCALAGLRVFLFSAAFPLFNPVDEFAHYDLVYKFARGYWPTQPSEPFDAAPARIAATYGTWEYLKDSAPVTRPLNERFWEQSPETIQRELARKGQLNHEAHSAPVYYAVAALWHRLGESLGLEDGGQVYWVRFLNPLVYAGLVWLAYVYCCMGCGQRLEIRLGVPLLVAFFPQDVFYGVNSDVLSPLLFTATLIGVLKWWRDEHPSVWLSAAVGLGAALTVLVKLTNVGLFVILGAVVASRVRASVRQGTWRALAVAATTAVLAAALPVGLWMARNYALFGDLTPRPKVAVAVLGWSHRPWTAILDHPLFTFEHAGRYFRHLLSVYWSGEYPWHGKPLVTRAYELFYAYSSPLLLLAAAISGWSARRAQSPNPFIALNWAAVLLSIACLVTLSVGFGVLLPAGRLIIGMLVPFTVLYIEGIALILRPLRWAGAPLAAVALLVVAIMVNETALTLPVFKSPFNWFHLP